MDVDELKELIEIADKYGISNLSTDNRNESISILANTFIYSSSKPQFEVESSKDVDELKERVVKYINTEKWAGVKLINVMENTLFKDLSELRIE